MSVLLTNANERRRFMRFAMVGVIGFIVDFGVYNWMLILLPVEGLPISRVVLAGVISFLAAIMSNFMWNRFWTYPDSRTKPVVGQLAQFGLVSVMGLGIRIPLLWALEPPLRSLFELLLSSYNSALVDFMAHNADLAIAVVVVMFWNFFANRYWTYNDIES